MDISLSIRIDSTASPGHKTQANGKRNSKSPSPRNRITTNSHVLSISDCLRHYTSIEYLNEKVVSSLK